MSGTTREVITLQFGEFANHVGSHYWNLQDESIGVNGHDSEVNHPVLYRSGQTERGEATLVPRLLLFDLRSNLGPLREGGYLYGQSQYDASSATAAAAAWGGAVQTVAQEPAYKNAFLRYLDGEGQGEPSEEADNNNAAGAHHQPQNGVAGAVAGAGGHGGGIIFDLIAAGGAPDSASHRRRRADVGDSDDDYDSDDNDFGENDGGCDSQSQDTRGDAATELAPLQAAEELEARLRRS